MTDATAPSGSSPESASAPAIVIGGGPAGLMAADVLSRGGHPVEVYDAMPSMGRKFLLAGVGGMNLTHAEEPARFLERYGAARDWLAPMLTEFGAEALRAFAAELGIATFVGSSGRVFPTDMKAAPLLRAWLHRLRADGVRLHTRSRFLGWTDDGTLRIATSEGEIRRRASATVLALGGGSWPRLGSDGSWQALLAERGVALSPLVPANCGFDADLPAEALARHAGQPIKPVVATVQLADGTRLSRQGEAVLTATGIEGGLIYALSAPLRDAIAAQGEAVLELDLVPGRDRERLEKELSRGRGSKSWSSFLASQVGIKGAKLALLRSAIAPERRDDARHLAETLKACRLRLNAPRPLAEAISSAGGVRREAVNETLMLKALPGVFCAGEMLDWEAPTGGYLLTACFASGHRAGLGALTWLASVESRREGQ